jgi:hypothetical protein
LREFESLKTSKKLVHPEVLLPIVFNERVEGGNPKVKGERKFVAALLEALLNLKLNAVFLKNFGNLTLAP